MTIAVPRHRQLSPGVGAVDSEGRRLVSRRSCMAVSGADPSRGVDLRMQIRNGCKLLTVAFESVSPMPPKSPLYERDFFAWSRERAELLRAGKLAGADIEHLAEEIDSMGRAEKRELSRNVSKMRPMTHGKGLGRSARLWTLRRGRSSIARKLTVMSGGIGAKLETASTLGKV